MAEACKETTLPFSGGTCVLLCPALSCPPHLSLASPHLFPLPLPRSVEFRPWLFGNDAKCYSQMIEQTSIPQPSTYFQCVPCWSFLSLCWGSAYSWGSFGRTDVEMDLSLSLVVYFPKFPSSPRDELACCWQHAREFSAWRRSKAGTAFTESTERLPVAIVSAVIWDVIRKTIRFSNFQDRGNGCWLIIGSCFKKTCVTSLWATRRAHSPLTFLSRPLPEKQSFWRRGC